MAAANDHPQHLSADEKATLQRLLAAIEAFRELHPTAPLHLVSAFLRVGLQEGKGVTDYARDASVAPTVMSRHMLDLGMKMRSNKPGMGLVETRQNPMELRRHEARLTREGVRLAKEMLRHFGNKKG